MSRRTLTLRPPPAKIRKRKLPPNDPIKVGLSQNLGLRFIDQEGRYILQARMVLFSPEVRMPQEHTWVDIPLVPEVYG